MPYMFQFVLQPGSVFGWVGIQAKNMLKTDIIHYFEGCDLSPANVKVEYNKAYNPTGMSVYFILFFLGL